MLALVAPSRSILTPVIGVIVKTSTRNNSYSYSRVISGPPRIRISFAEKVAHGIVMAVGCSAIPFIISVEMPTYNQEPPEED